MGFTTQDIRDKYERMDTEALLSLTGNDLTDVARGVLNEVLATRGVSHDTIGEARARIAERNGKAAAMQERLAPIGARIAAFAIDFLGVMIILYIVLLPVSMVSDTAHDTIALCIFWGYFLFRDGIPGQGLGKRVMSLRTEQLTGKPATLANSFWRNLTHFFFVIDALFALGERRMRLGDMIAGTRVTRR